MTDNILTIIKLRRNADKLFFRSKYEAYGTAIIFEDLEGDLLKIHKKVLRQMRSFHKYALFLFNHKLTESIPKKDKDLILKFVNDLNIKSFEETDDIFCEIALCVSRISLDSRFIKEKLAIYRKEKLIYNMQGILDKVISEASKEYDGKKKIGTITTVLKEMSRFAIFFGDNNNLKTTNTLAMQDGGDKLLVAVARVFDAIVSDDSPYKYLVKDILLFLRENNILVSYVLVLLGKSTLAHCPRS